MKLFPVCFIFWCSLLLLWASQSETQAESSDVCQGHKSGGELIQEISNQAREATQALVPVVNENFTCLLSPTSTLNCSWSFQTLENNTHLSVYISICDNEMRLHSLNHSSQEKGGSAYWPSLYKPENLYVILQFNMSLHDKWRLYTYTYDIGMLEVMFPPQNLFASVKDGNLEVTWDLPNSSVSAEPDCFDYELDLGDEEKIKSFSEQTSYTEQNADPSRTYRVKMRTRIADHCKVHSPWSDWSQPVTVKQSLLSTLVIVSISLGIPMILLAVLLLVRSQRVSQVLFPPIPRPPPKYMHFLEKNDTYIVFHPPEPAEEITEVDDTEDSPGETQKC